MPKWALNLDYDYITDRTSSVGATLNDQLSDRYRLLVNERYQLRDMNNANKGSLETSIVLRRLLHEWVLDLGLRRQDANNQTAFIIGFGPAGWGVFKDPHRAAPP